MAELEKCFVHVDCGHHLVLTGGAAIVCTSSFVDDVSFSHNGQYGTCTSCVLLSKVMIM